jgi:hypothetical protein
MNKRKRISHNTLLRVNRARRRASALHESFVEIAFLAYTIYKRESPLTNLPTMRVGLYSFIRMISASPSDRSELLEYIENALDELEGVKEGRIVTSYLQKVK